MGAWLIVLLLATFGVLSVLGGLSHIFRGRQTAALIGWPAGNPFQFEVGIADVALGVLGIMCIWERGRFWLATVVATSIFGFGVSIGHVQQIVQAASERRIHAPRGGMGHPAT